MEVKIISSARPLQIQRSVEGSQSAVGEEDAKRSREFYCEETHSRTKVNVQRPLTPSDLLKVANFSRIVVFTLFVLAATLICILTEDDISLAYILSVVSVISMVAFHLLKL